MALHRRRKLTQPGLPEVLMLAVILLTAFTGTLWWRRASLPNLVQTRGRVSSCDIVRTHYNATVYRDKVIMTYEYFVGTRMLSGTYEGFWEEANSPNALPEDELEALKRTGYPLEVLYHPSDPTRSVLHYPNKGSQLVYPVLFLASMVLTCMYCFWGYPAWRGK